MFLLILNGLRITRSFIKATMTFECDNTPINVDYRTLSTWDANFIAYKPAIHNAFKQLMVEDVDVQRRTVKSVTM